MRHRKKGRRLGRSSSHRKAMLRNMASSLFLTEREADLDDNEPKVKGRIVTTMQKAKEVRPLVERCITIARRSLEHQAAAAQFSSDADRGTDAWKSWRTSEDYRQWNAKMAPALAARRRVLRLLGDKQAVGVVFEEVAPRFADRPGGYTRILKLAQPRLGDGGQRAILEFVGVHDRQTTAAARPDFASDVDTSDVDTSDADTEEPETEPQMEASDEGVDNEAASTDEAVAEAPEQESGDEGTEEKKD